MLEDIAGAYGSRFFLAAGGVGLALLCLIAILWLVRKRAPSPFVRGGKNRQPRLQVLDAAAVDARRRLVLVRRDGVEHLIMIGGPTDIVIESGISDPSRPGGTAIPSLQVSALSEPVVALPAPQPQLVASRPAIAALPAAQKADLPEIETRHEPEPVVARRPVAVATPVPQELFEPAPVATVSQPKQQAEPSPAIEPAVVHRPAAAVAPVVPAPAAEAERAPAPPVQQAAKPAPISESSVAEILDAARSKIMPQHIEHQKPISPPPQAVAIVPAPAPHAAPREEPRPAMVAAPIVASAEPVAAAPAVAPPQRAEPRELGGDFQSFLEAEMSNNLAAERLVPNTPPAQRPAQPAPAAQPVPGQRRDPEMAPITGADTELQTEVARIFGEMSVNRDR